MKTKKYYHGGIPGLNKGDILLPPLVTGKSTLLEYSREIDPNGAQQNDRVYITTDKLAADMFAFVYPNGDTYKVVPIGDLENDPDCLEDGLSFQCSQAKVIAVLRRG